MASLARAASVPASTARASNSATRAVASASRALYSPAVDGAKAGCKSASVCPAATASPMTGNALPGGASRRPGCGVLTCASEPGRAATIAGTRLRSTRRRFVTGSALDRIFHCCSLRKLTPSGAAGSSACCAACASAKTSTAPNSAVAFVPSSVTRSVRLHLPGLGNVSLGR